MRSPFYSIKAATATVVSLWMAVLACFLGCSMPVFANSSSVAPQAVTQPVPEPMMGMENCPHHAKDHLPAQPKDGQPVPAGRMSCCPLEVTLAPKAKVESLSVIIALGFLLASAHNLTPVRFYPSVAFVPEIPTTGRDTLLKTQLLRI